MNIPGITSWQLVDKDGNITPEWIPIFTQLIQQLQQNLPDTGYKMPEQTSADIALRDNINSKAVLLYNSDTDELMINKAGTFKNILTT